MSNKFINSPLPFAGASSGLILDELFVYRKSWEVLRGMKIDMLVASDIMSAISLTDQKCLITAPPARRVVFVNYLKGKYNIQKRKEENGGKEENCRISSSFGCASSTPKRQTNKRKLSDITSNKFFKSVAVSGSTLPFAGASSHANLDEFFFYRKSWDVLGGMEIDMPVASAIMSVVSLTHQKCLITAPPAMRVAFVNSLKGKYNIQKRKVENGVKEEK